MYKANIYFNAIEDNYEDGEQEENSNSWDETFTAHTQSELRDKVLEATFSKWEDLDDEQISEYDHATEYSTIYLADEHNVTYAKPEQVEAWKRGELRLWAIHCHILVTEVTEKKASF